MFYFLVIITKNQFFFFFNNILIITALRFLQFGAFPVFVTDGTPSPLKSRARIARFFHASGIDLSDLPVAEEGVSVERNTAFSKCVQECVVGCLFYHAFHPAFRCVGIMVFLFCASISSVSCFQ